MDIFGCFTELELTSDQQKALSRVERFLTGTGSVFLLNGYAGTGKTTLLNGLCRYLGSVQQHFVLMAPTGRAAMVLQKRTGQSACTIHRGIYNIQSLLEKEEGTSFKYYFQIAGNNHPVNTVFLVDEASMISDVYNDNEFFVFGSGRLLTDLLEFVFAGSDNRKIIFIGDKAQLPPVNMSFSPALDEPYLLEAHSIQSTGVWLRQVVRQIAGSGILKSATDIRDALEKNEFNDFDLHCHSEVVEKTESLHFREAYMGMIKKAGVDNCMVITYANQQALFYNEIIREMRYVKPGLPLQNKDTLIITKNNYNGDVELYNGTFAKVVQVGEISYIAQPHFQVKGGKVVSRRLVFRDVLLQVPTLSGESVVLKCTILDDFLTAPTGSLHPYDQRALYIDFKNRMQKSGITPKSASFKERMKKDIYFNAVQARYGYAITCHKSQGGEWDHVMVDFNVFTGTRTAGFFRWAYTAITRAATSLVALDAVSHSPLSNYVVKEIQQLRRVQPGMYPLNGSENFMGIRIERLIKITREQEMEMNFEYLDYQVFLTFKRAQQNCTVRLWYGNAGFTRTTWVQCSHPDFRTLVETIHFGTMPNMFFPFRNQNLHWESRMKCLTAL